MATNSTVGRPIWPKFELVQEIMHFLVTCTYKFKHDRIDSNREKADIDVLDAQGRLTQ